MVKQTKQSIGEVFNALSDDNRREIVAVLTQHDGLSMGNVTGKFPSLSRQAVSKHIDLLVSAGFITKKKKGRAVICSLNPKPFKKIDNWVKYYDQFWDNKLADLKNHLDKK